MANANWNDPQLSSTYTDFVSEVKDRDEDVATQFQSTSATNIPTNAVQWDASAGRWKKYTGTTWGELTTNYKLTSVEVTGTTKPANGLYLPTANTPTFTSNSTERLRFSSAGAFGLSGANYGTAGQAITSNGNGSAPTWQTPWLFVSTAVICDLKATTVDGGDFTSGAWQTRDLNTTIFDADGIVTLSSNQFTLGVGSYVIEFSAPAYDVNYNQARLFDVTAGQTVASFTGIPGNGISQAARANSSYNESSTAKGTARVTVSSGTRTYEVQHKCSSSRTITGFGIASDMGEDEIYTVVKIYKEAG
jgi:hypothetical protein